MSVGEVVGAFVAVVVGFCLIVLALVGTVKLITVMS